jgi:hypothetical protein
MEPAKAALSLPNEFYYIAGVLFVANVGTIVTILIAAMKTVWWASKLDSRVDDAKATAVRAHKRIDRFADEVGEEEFSQ